MSIDEILQEVQSSYTRLKEAEARARYGYEHYLDDLKATYQQQLQEIENSFRQARQQVNTKYQQQLDGARSDFEQASQQVQAQLADMTSSFRWVVAPWDDSAWDAYEPLTDTSAPSCVRIGQLELEDARDFPSLPALAAFIGHGPIFITSEPETISAAQQLLQTLVLRLVVTVPPGMVRLSMADPVGQGTNLAAFLHLPGPLRGDKIYSRPDELERLLERLESHSTEVIQTRLLNLYATIEEYNQQTSGVSIPYYVLVLADFPAGFNDRMVEQLLNIVRNSQRTGVYVLATINPNYPLPRNFKLTDVTGLGTTLHFTTPNRLTWNDLEFGQYSVMPDSMPPVERVNSWLDSIGQTIQQTPKSLPFDRIVIPENKRWRGSVLESLTVPIGMNSKGEVHSLELGMGIVHHGLIGGTVGSGKSNLLHVLITQLALFYSPEELELYLLDFKEGVEFQDYVNLPHARAVALETEREFGLSILRRIAAEMEERGRQFRSASVSLRSEYCQQTGRPMPRIVAIMDEFQVLFAEEDMVAREAGRILEDVVRRGRSFGIHILLSSQSPSVAGIYGNRIYNQMGLRIALKCRAQDAQAILGEGNDAANRLELPGEAIYNDEMGHKEKNVFIRVALLPTQERRRYLANIQELTSREQRMYPAPVTFEGRALARLEDNPALQALLLQSGWLSPNSPAQVWLGQPIEIKPPTAATLERYPRSNLLIVGGEETQAYGLLLATLISLAAQRSPSEASFYIADFARPDSPFASFFAPLKNTLPHPLEIAGPRAVGPMQAQLHSLVNQRLSGETSTTSNLYFLVAGMHRWRELRGSDAYGPPPEAAKQLLRIAEEGPELGMHLVAWTDGFATLERTIKRNGIGNFDLRAVLRVPEPDSNALLGSPIAARLEDNRAFFRHEDWEMGKLEKFKPYAVPEPEALAHLLEQIHTKGLQ